MKFLVAGGAGFIGSHLCDRLLKSGNRVICADNLLTGSKTNIQTALKNDNFEFIQVDICKSDFVEKIMEKNLDFVINLASPASPVDYLNFPVETMKVGSIGTLNTLELANACNAKYFFASTSEVYGDPKVSPQNEGYWGNVNPIGPRSVYDESKRFSEALIFSYKRKFNLDIKIARIFNTYGPRMRKNDGRVIPNFISQALKDMPLTIYGDGSQTRSFCYIDDLIDGTIKMLESNETGPINLGNPNEFTIKELAEMVNKNFNKPLSNIKFSPLPEDDPKQRRPDISKAKNLLGWEPKIDLQTGLELTIKWFLSL